MQFAYERDFHFPITSRPVPFNFAFRSAAKRKLDEPGLSTICARSWLVGRAITSKQCFQLNIEGADQIYIQTLDLVNFSCFQKILFLRFFCMVSAGSPGEVSNTWIEKGPRRRGTLMHRRAQEKVQKQAYLTGPLDGEGVRILEGGPQPRRRSGLILDPYPEVLGIGPLLLGPFILSKMLDPFSGPIQSWTPFPAWGPSSMSTMLGPFSLGPSKSKYWTLLLAALQKPCRKTP